MTEQQRIMPPVPEDEFDKDAYLGEFTSTVADFDQQIESGDLTPAEVAARTDYRDRIEAARLAEEERLANSIGG